jgi:RNA polymerase sigma-70 factor (ECF subfamily)
MRPADRELLERIRAREAAAFELFFERYRESVCRTLARMVRDENAARDLAQEVFLRVWTRAEQWDGRGAARAWLFRIATNLALNHLRSLRRRREEPLELPPDPASEEERPVPAWMVDEATLGPEAALELAERAARLRQLVEELPEEKREVFRMAHEDQMEMREIAQQLAIPEGTVRSRLHHARQRLARAWNELEREGEK